jgi:hypothetical protein
MMQKFDTPAPVSTVLVIPAGRIRLIAEDRTDTTVEILPADPSRSRDVEAAEQIKTAYADGVLRIEVPKAKTGIFGPSGSVEVTVQLPAGSGIEAKTAAAELSGVGRLGDVVFDGAHGPVTFDEADTVRLTGLDADVTVVRLNGSAEISNQKGSIHITEATRGTLTLGTQMGDITVGAARGVSAVLDAGTAYGRVSNTLKNSGTPALTIHATTAHGDITAHSL